MSLKRILNVYITYIHMCVYMCVCIHTNINIHTYIERGGRRGENFIELAHAIVQAWQVQSLQGRLAGWRPSKDLQFEFKSSLLAEFLLPNRRFYSVPVSVYIKLLCPGLVYIKIGLHYTDYLLHYLWSKVS